jgi:hypothetical protein
VTRAELWSALLAASLVIASPVRAQLSIPRLEGAAIQAKVEAGVVGDIEVWEYLYSLRNESEDLLVYRIKMDLKSDPSRIELSADELGTPPGFRRSINLSTEPHVSAISTMRPPGWSGAIDVHGDLAWSSTAGLPPGEEAILVSLESKGLPGIREVTFIPDIWDFRPNVDDPDLDVDPAAVAAAVLAANQTVKTVGPVAPPREFSALAFADEILRLRDQARTLGWIRSGAQADAVDALLDGLRTALVSGATATAYDSIAQLIQEVDAAACAGFDCGESSTFTAEARALLVVNLRYLKDQLPSVEPR